MLKMVDVFSGSPRSFATLPETDITMVKATQGTGYVNPACNIDYANAKAAGKLLGLYHYCAGGNPIAEADYFINNIKNYVGEANDCPLWVAYYKYSQPLNWDYQGAGFNIAPWEVFTIHQFTGSDMDRNMVNTTKEGWLKMANPNNNISIPEPSPIQPVEEHKDEKEVSFVDELGDTWFKEDGKFTLDVAVNLRYGARTTSDIITTLPAGSTIKYDAFSRHAGYVWIRQPRENGYGYMAVRDAKTNQPFGKFE